MQVAQTNIQLYNQLRVKGLPLEDLAFVHRAYEFLTTLYTGCFQGDGKPFVAHGVGVASILAELDHPTEVVTVGLLHNIYGNGNFGDGRARGVTRSRRRLVREAVGGRIEQLLARFPEIRIERRTIREVRAMLPGLDEDDRRLIVVDLVDYMEKYQDLGVLYYGNNDWILSVVERSGEDLVRLASELGEPRLAELLSVAFATVDAQRGSVPTELRPSDGRRHMKLIVPRSHAPRLTLRLRVRTGALRHRLRVRTRLRHLVSAARRPSRASA
jgi:(p)ppGpp synthase/HD superfamily hydrolase